MKSDWLTVGKGEERRRIALGTRAGEDPGLLWLGGYRSNMYGTKAEALDKFAEKSGRAFRRFDYSGHGASELVFEDRTVSHWLEEARCVFALGQTPQIVIGSSMGGWLALLLADEVRKRGETGAIAGLILIAPAVDMTHALMWERMSRAAQRQLIEAEIYFKPNANGGEPTPITKS